MHEKMHGKVSIAFSVPYKQMFASYEYFDSFKFIKIYCRKETNYTSLVIRLLAMEKLCKNETAKAKGKMALLKKRTKQCIRFILLNLIF